MEKINLNILVGCDYSYRRHNAVCVHNDKALVKLCTCCNSYNNGAYISQFSEHSTTVYTSTIRILCLHMHFNIDLCDDLLTLFVCIPCDATFNYFVSNATIHFNEPNDVQFCSIFFLE